MDVPEFAASPRPRAGPGEAVGIDEAMIRALVPAFYAKVRRDPELGPIFDREVADWDEHLDRLCDFWSSVLLMTGRFKGQPMAVHARIDDIEPRHFGRWLELFEATARALWPVAAADLVTAKARQIGESLKLGIAFSRGEPPPRPAPR
jgi:hemoglobin